MTLIRFSFWKSQSYLRRWGITGLVALCCSCGDASVANSSEALKTVTESYELARREFDPMAASEVWGEVVHSATRALESDSLSEAERFEAYKMRAEARQNLGENGPAASDLERVLQQHPEDVGLRLNYAVVLDLLGQKERSLEQLSEVLRLEPNQIDARELRGTVLAALGRNAEAIEDISQVLAVDSSSGSLIELRGDLFSASGQSIEAIQDYESAYRLLESLLTVLPGHTDSDVSNPKAAGILVKIAGEYERLGDSGTAIEIYQRAVELDSRQRDALARLKVLSPP